MEWTHTCHVSCKDKKKVKIDFRAYAGFNGGKDKKEHPNRQDASLSQVYFR